jgi:hypothetical protein
VGVVVEEWSATSATEKSSRRNETSSVSTLTVSSAAIANTERRAESTQRLSPFRPASAAPAA